MAHEITSPNKPASIFPDNDGAVKLNFRSSPNLCCYRIFKKNDFTEFSTD